MRPLPSGVAVACARGVAMFAVADQLPVAVLELEARAGTISASTTLKADAADLMLMTKPPCSSGRSRRAWQGRLGVCPYETLKPRSRRMPAVHRIWADPGSR